MPNRQLLITRPNHDNITHYLCERNQEVVDAAKQKGFDVHDLKGLKAIRKNVESYLKKHEYSLLTFNGHGNCKQIMGHGNNEILIESEVNHELLSKKITYSVACSSAKDLGKRSVQAGAKAYIGYNNDFAIIRDKNMTTRPLKDKLAECFLRPSNQIPLTLLKGKSVSESITIAKNLFRQEIEKLQSSESIIGAENVVIALLWDLSALIYEGESSSTI